MDAQVFATGYTNVILVLNMKRFIQEEDQDRFESIRGTRDFADTIQKVWPGQCLERGVFISALEDKQRRNLHDTLTAEEVGFATGIFRSPYIEEHTFPTYAVDKNKFPFEPYLKENFQFANLFWRAWQKWNIYLRPTSTGMFVIRMTREYEKPAALLTLGSDVIELQESLDVRSALNWMRSLDAIQDDEKRNHKKETVQKFLDWLGAGEEIHGELHYVPVQWKLAMTIASEFVKEVEFTVPLDDGQPPVHLQEPPARLSNPLHDSYVVYHLDEISASRWMVPRLASPPKTESGGPTQKHSSKTLVAVRTNDIHKSREIQQQMANLLEGSILVSPNSEGESTLAAPTAARTRRFFPDLEPGYPERVLGGDLASWVDELCLFSTRAAILMPSHKVRDCELLISTIPGSTSRVLYVRYWGALERMIEFLIEIRVLAQLIERSSYTLLGDMASTMHLTRKELLRGDIKLDTQTYERQIAGATHLRHLAALCQGLSNPQTWSRAEYAVQKANYLLNLLGVPLLIDQIDRNIDSINSAVEHLDELYMADLAEDSNDISFVLTLGLAAVSFLLTILIIPSFWADLTQASASMPYNIVIDTTSILGNIMGFGSIITSIVLALIVLRQPKKIWTILKKFLFQK